MLDDTIPTQTLTYWGNPETGEGVPAGQVWDTVSDYLFTAASMSDDVFNVINDSLDRISTITIAGREDIMQGGQGDQFNNTGDGSVTVGDNDADTGFDTGKEGDYTGNYQIRVTLQDGTVAEAVVALTQEQFEYLNGLLFDADGNSRLFEKEVPVTQYLTDTDEDGDGLGDVTGMQWRDSITIGTGADAVTYQDVVVDSNNNPIAVPVVIKGDTIVTDYPIILKPNYSNGGIEEGAVGNMKSDDLIVAGRLELLHGAYIDGGEGENTLEIDAKGHFAQPKELLNIQHVKVENLPNIYTTVDSDGDVGNGYPDVQEGGVADTNQNSIIDLSRAVDIETLTVTEGSFQGLNGQTTPGALTLTGIRNGVTTTLDGGFTQNVTLNYGELTDAAGVNLVFHNLSMGDADTEGGALNAQLNVAHNAETLNIESTGAGNFLDNGNLGGELSTLNISGDAHLYIEDDLNPSFHNGNPVTIDASANTGGVNLTLTGSEQITFMGSQGDDRFAANTVEFNTAGVPNLGGSDQRVTIVDMDGDNYFQVESSHIDITVGDGANKMELDGGGFNDDTGSMTTATVVAGNGANDIAARDLDIVNITTGDGDNKIGVNADEITITTGAGNDTVIVSGEGVTSDLEDNDSTGVAVNNTALLNINVGAGENTVVLGGDVNGVNYTSGVTATEGSVITGENITLYVEEASDLRAAELSGINNVVLDLGTSDQIEGDSAVGTYGGIAPVLTLTDAQFLAIGAENFSVDEAVFDTYGQLKIIVTESTSLTDLGVDSLPSGIDLVLELRDGVQLTLTAQQLHEKVAPQGIILADDKNTDQLSGSVMITDAGLDFDPFNNSDQVRTDIDGAVYYGGSLSSDDFSTDTANDGVQQGEWGSNVLIDRNMNGYDRPADAPSYSRLVINTDEMSEIGPFDTIETFLRIVGDSDLTFTPVEAGRDEWGRPIEGGSAIEIGIDTAGSGTGNPFIIDFSSVTGDVNNLTIARFEDAQEIYGNGARLNVELTDNVGTDEAGLFSRGVHTYVVTAVDTDANSTGTPATVEDEVLFYTCETTQDLETLGLQGNHDATVNFLNTERGVDFLMEVVRDKEDGYSVGTLVGEFAREGADAVVNVVGLDTLPAGEEQVVAGIELVNAATAAINVTGGNTVIESLAGTTVKTFTFTADADLTIETSFITADVTEVVDGTGVAGDFNLTVAGTIDLSEVDLLGVDQILLKDGANLTLSAQQLVDLADKIVEEEGANATLNVVDLSTEALDLAAIDVDNIGSVTIADVDGVVTLDPATNLGDADSVTIQTEESDTTVEMTVEQFFQIEAPTGGISAPGFQDPDINGEANTGNSATIVLTNFAGDEKVGLAFVDNADVVIRVDGVTAVEDNPLTTAVEQFAVPGAGFAGKITLEVTEGDNDLTNADLSGIDAVTVADGATLTITAAQAALIGIADTDANGVAENWSGTGTINIVDLSNQELDLNDLQGAGLNIGTVTIDNTDAAILIDEDTTFGGADEIVTPTADAGAPEWGTEQTQVTMTVDQFLSSAGIITGDSQINLTDLYNNVDTDDDFVPDSARFDLSGIANAGTITFADDTVNYVHPVDGQTTQHVVTLHADANLGGFTIALGNGDLIRFDNEAQAAATITANTGDITGVQWLWTEFGAEVDTSGYDEDIATLFIDEALLVSQSREEDLWSTLHGSITVEKVDGDTIPELIKYNRVNTFEAFTNIGGGINYDDSADFGTLANLTMNLEGEVNLGNILLGDTNNGDGTTESNNINGVGFFEKLVINSYLDLSNNPELSNQDPETSGRVIEANYLGDISLNAGSVDQLVDITINTYGKVANSEGFTDDANVNGATAQRDGLAIETGTITFASNDGETVTSTLGNGANAVLTITGSNDVTIEAIDISDAEVSRLDVNVDSFIGNGGELTIGGININDLDDEMGLSTGTPSDVLDGIVYIDGYIAETGDTIGFDPTPSAPGESSADILLVVTDGTNDLTAIAATPTSFDVKGVYVTGDATITLTEAQVQAIGEGNFSVAAGVNVTLNVTDIPNDSDIDLNAIQDAGFNIGTLSTADENVTLDDAATLGGADAVVVMLDDTDRTFTLTAEQHSQISGNITELDQDATTANKASVVVTNLGDLATETYNTAIGSKAARDYDVTNIDLSNVLTTGDNEVEVNDATINAGSLNADGVSRGDVMLHPDANLGNFAVVLQSEGVNPNDLLGQNIRFFTPEQASREVIVLNDDGSNDNGTNVIWLFDTLPAGTKIDTANYSDDLGRVWILGDLADGTNVEELYTDLSESIIVRIVNGDDLSTLLPGTDPFTRVVEVESFTQLPGGLTFNDIDEANGQPYDFIENLTITLGGAVTMGNLAVDNVIATPLSNDDEFITLTINSFLANSVNHYLLPEDFVAGTNPLPSSLGTASDQWNYIGDIRGSDQAYSGTGTQRIELETVVVNTSVTGEIGTALDIQTIFFSEEAGETSGATFTANGVNNVTVKSLDTADAGITGLTVNNNLVGATLLVTGGSPAFNGGATGNTETLSVTTLDSDAVTTFGSADDSDGVGVYAGVYGPELSSITVDGSGTTNLGTLADIDGTIDTEVSPNGFEFTATGSGTVTATLGEANVDGNDIAPAIEAGEAWTFTFDDNGGADSALTVESTVEFNGGEVEFAMGNADLIIDGDVDMQALTGLTYSGSGNVVLTTDATLQLTDEQWLNSGFKAAFDANRFVDENGQPTVLTVDADFVAEFGSDLTHVFGYAEYNIESGVTVTLREDQADAAYVDGDDQNPGDLTGATVTVFVQEMVDTSDPLDGIGDDDVFGDNDITNLVGVDALVIEADTTDSTIDTPDVIQTFGYSVTMTVEQADSLVGNIIKNGNTVIALAGVSGEDPDAGVLKDLSGLDLTEVDTLTLEDADGTILTVAQYAALGGANIDKDGNSLSLIGAGDQTALDMTDGGDPANQVVDALILNGNMTITATQEAALTSTITMENPADTHSLTITDVSGLGADVLPANGDGFPDANSTLTLNLLNVTVDSVTAELHTNTKDPADGVTDIDGNFILAGNLNGATLELTGTGTLASDVTVVNGATVTNVTDTVTVNLTDTTVALHDPNTDPASDDSIDLSGIEAAIAGTLTLGGATVLDPLTDLGAFDVVMGANNLTATGAQISGATVTSTMMGNLTLNGVTTAHDLSNLTIGGDLTINVEDAASFDINAVQADGATINDVLESTPVALAQVNVLEFENALGADLSQLDSTNDGFAIDVQLDSTGGVEIGATANLSTINDGNDTNGEAGDSQVTISGTGVVTVAQDANVSSTDFIVGAGSTLTADQSLTGVSLITEADDANVSGAGTLLYTGMDSASITLEQDVRISVVELSAGDASVDINGFQAGTFVWDAVELELGAHRLDFTSFITTPMTYTDVATGLGDETGNAHDIFSFSIGELGDFTAATVEAEFADTGAFDAVGDGSAVTFATNAELIFLIDGGAETGIWHYQDGIGGTADGIVEQGELSLIGVVDLQHTAHANLVDQNFILV